MRSQMQYKTSFILQFIGQFVVTFIDFMAILFIFNKFSNIKGWTLWEVGLLYGMTSVSFAIAEIMARGFDVFDRMIRFGELDRFLLRPAGIFIQIFTAELDLRKFGRLLQAIIVLVISWHRLGLAINLFKIVFLTVSVFCGSFFYIALLIIGSTVCFWSIQSYELPNMLTYGGVETSSYPISAYKKWFRNVFIFIIPLAFVNYFPALYLLGKPDPMGMPYFLSFLFPLASALIMFVAVKFWNFGVRHYTSTGS
jgi:ABC-2 type transport system permease protein